MSKPGPSGDASANANAGEGLPSPRVVLYPPERVRLDWRQAHRIGAGLVNLGNTCFFNSTLQCLTYTAPLVNYCFSEEHPKTCMFIILLSFSYCARWHDFVELPRLATFCLRNKIKKYEFVGAFIAFNCQSLPRKECKSEATVSIDNALSGRCVYAWDFQLEKVRSLWEETM